jgi:serine phosphatase RsbU (regulator of sigma subunit)
LVRGLCWLLVIALGIGLPLAGLAQATGAAASSQATDVASPWPAVHLRMGHSAFPLNGPWRFSVGDSPVDAKTGKPLWAEPSFDDSMWETVDLTPPEGSYEPLGGTAGYVPGWTAKGHSGYWGYAWYRIRVQLKNDDPSGAAQKLALEGPQDFDDVFQVYANGSLLGGFRTYSGKAPATYYSTPTLFPIPQPVSSSADSAAAESRASAGSDSQTEVIVFRVWMGPGTLLTQPDAGGLHNPPVLGEAGAVGADYQLRWLELVREYSTDAALGLLFAVLALVAFSLVLFDRTDRVYLWIGAVFLLQAIYYGLFALDGWTENLSVVADTLVRNSLLFSLITAGWVMVWWIWFGRQRPAWIPWAAAGLALLWMVAEAVGAEVFFGLVPHGVAADFEKVTLVVRVLFFALMLGIVIQGIRRLGLEGWLVLPAILLRGIAVFSRELALLHISLNLNPFGVDINLVHLATLLMALAVALLLLRRLLQSVKAQRLLALDVKQAQEVQQLIVPAKRVVHPGLTIESVYRPARQVSGDFFQIIPNAGDGSLLIVAGDVTGKGLRAGMLVALLVGAIRTAARFDPDPVAVLGELNQRLMGRGDATATCLAMRIDSRGAVTLANAGHVPPYFNGELVQMEGALPLGMVDGANCSVMRFALKPHDRLVLVSDGILEATDSDGQLFGFERVHELVGSAASAVEVADAAEKFGQEDDISVISITRTVVPEPAVA